MEFPLFLFILAFGFLLVFSLSNECLTGELDLAAKIRNMFFMLKLNGGHLNLQILNSSSLLGYLNFKIFPNLIVFLDGLIESILQTSNNLL